MLHPPFINKIYVSKIFFLSILGFVLALALSAINTVWAVYLRQFVESDAMVGFISSFFALTAFLAYFFAMPYIAKRKKMETFQLSMIILFLCFVAFYFLNGSSMLIYVVLVGMVCNITTVFRSVSYGILVRDQSKLEDLGKNESLNYSLLNMGFVIGPLLVGFILKNYLPNLVFLIFSFFILIALVFSFHLNSNNIKRKETVNSNLIKHMISYFKDINRLKIYLIATGLSMWWAMIYIFLPLYILNNNLGAEWVGYALFGVATPLIVLEYLFGSNADKIGSRFFFIIGFTILGLSAFGMFLFYQHIYIVIALSILASIGAACIEPLIETYYFKATHKEDEKYYGSFLTSYVSGSTLGKLIPAFILLSFNFEYIFFFLGLQMLLFAYMASTMKNLVKNKG